MWKSLLLITLIVVTMGSNNQPGNVDQGPLSNNPLNACQAGYYFNGQICMQCLVIDGGTCSCSLPNQCDYVNCQSGYYSFGLSCIKHPDTNCLKGGFSADGTTIVCFTCNSQSTQIGGICIQNNNCIKYDTSTGICTQCAAAFYNVLPLYAPGDFNVPQTVTDFTNYFKSFQSCLPCNKICATCTTDLICNSCVKGYYLSENSCYRCVDAITNCDVCDNSTKCTQCATGSYLINDQCTLCTTLDDDIQKDLVSICFEQCFDGQRLLQKCSNNCYKNYLNTLKVVTIQMKERGYKVHSQLAYKMFPLRHPRFQLIYSERYKDSMQGEIEFAIDPVSLREV